MYCGPAENPLLLSMCTEHSVAHTVLGELKDWRI